MRKPFQGIWNIIRFNWHFYALAFVVVILSLSLVSQINSPLSGIIRFAAIAVLLTVTVSLAVSFYVYDCSKLYRLEWLDELKKRPKIAVTISAGFDETTEILKSKFPDMDIQIWDFYDPNRHTEISIRRARVAHPPDPSTEAITTHSLPMDDGQADLIQIHMAAHEIRNRNERRLFFIELQRVLADGGRICVVEHLRDVPNFLAYTIGVLHFYSKTEWMDVFGAAGLELVEEQKITPFVSLFILKK